MIPNTKVCSVAGVMAAGAICGYTLSDTTEDLTLAEFMEFLSPQSPEVGPALCVSTDDFAKLQIALEQACSKLGNKCTKEAQDQLKQVGNRLKKISKKKNK